MIAINFLHKLESKKSSSRPFHLIELGPGRGTLMNDVLRTFSSFSEFFNKIQKCSFVEMSPILKEIQAKNMKNWSDTIDFNWCDHIGGVNVQKDFIPIVIAQEFFDAIPIHVFKKTNGTWKELKVAKTMCLIEQPSVLTDILRLSSNFTDFPSDQTLELSPSSWAICQEIKNIFDRCKRGEGIFIDYGHFKPSTNSLRVIMHDFLFCSKRF
jgi:NADH dehydrogenase [ubiquinone] 1 alpha subcomplex assembly factor 7